MESCRMIGYVASDRGRLDCALHMLDEELCSAPGAGYGVGHYTDDALLLNRRPGVEVTDHRFAEFTGGIKTHMLLLHAFPLLARKVHASDLHPFKFRHWAAATTGDCEMDAALGAQVREEILESVPDFIRRNIKGEGIAEGFFHHFLWRLHGVNQLDIGRSEPGPVVAALRASIEFLHGCFERTGQADPCPQNALVTDGNILVALRAGGRLAYRLQEGITDCRLCFGDSEPLDSFSVRESHQRFRAVFVASDLKQIPAGWQEIESGAAVVVGSDLKVDLH